MNFYLFFKALHLIAIISWMAGLLYLPRIFVYHAETKNDDVKNIFKVIESCYDPILVIRPHLNTFYWNSVFR